MSQNHAAVTVRAALSIGAIVTILVSYRWAGASPSAHITIPGGTVVPVQLVDKVSSATANVGDTFAIQAASDVVVGGWIVIARGAQGQGEVTAVDRAGSHGHAGSFGLQMDWIYDADGHKVHLSNQKKTEEGESNKGTSSTVTVVSALLLGIPGLFAHNFVKGKNVEIDSTRTLQSFVDESVLVAPTAQATSAPDFAPLAEATLNATPSATPK